VLRILEIVRTHFAGGRLPAGRQGILKKSKAAGMTISSFSNELIITHFKAFFNVKMIEKCFGWRQILLQK